MRSATIQFWDTTPYLLPRLLGRPEPKLDVEHGSSYAEPEFVEQIPEPYLELWSDEEKKWAARLHESPEFRALRERCIEIHRRLDGLRPGPERSALVEELVDLKYR